MPTKRSTGSWPDTSRYNHDAVEARFFSVKKYVVHVSNPTSLDERICVTADEHDLAAVAHEAISKVMEACDGGFDLPMFIDIHAAENAPVFESMHAAVAM